MDDVSRKHLDLQKDLMRQGLDRLNLAHSHLDVLVNFDVNDPDPLDVVIADLASVTRKLKAARHHADMV